jgi:hypothetical protein
LESQLPYVSPLQSGSNRPLSYTFDYQVRALVYYHMETFDSALDLLQAAESDAFVKDLLVPDGGLGQSTFYEANATRGRDQMMELFDLLYKKACKSAPLAYRELGDLVAVDGTLIDSCLSMHWADYRAFTKKAKMHTGFDLNQGLPKAIVLTEGNGAERPFVPKFVHKGQTAVLDRGYQDHDQFDQWSQEGQYFVARVRNNTTWQVIELLPFEEGTSIFFFAKVLLGDGKHQMKHPVYVVGFKSEGKTYHIVTNREDLTAEQIAFVFSLRWAIETFFAWWKRHLKVYHLISRNKHGVLLQLLAGLITYLLLVIYFHRHYKEGPSIRRLRQLRWKIRQEARPNVDVTTCTFIQIDITLLALLWIAPKKHAIF